LLFDDEVSYVLESLCQTGMFYKDNQTGNFQIFDNFGKKLILSILKIKLAEKLPSKY
jgi:hypothetical protein